jgi:hypothetical protein
MIARSPIARRPFYFMVLFSLNTVQENNKIIFFLNDIVPMKGQVLGHLGRAAGC